MTKVVVESTKWEKRHYKDLDGEMKFGELCVATCNIKESDLDKSKYIAVYSAEDITQDYVDSRSDEILSKVNGHQNDGI